MASNLLAILFPLLISSVAGHNITKILSQFPNYSIFNSLLTKNQLANVINSRQTITVLTAANSAVNSTVSNQPAYVLKRILALHVVLDYYDTAKLSHLTNNTVILPTLFQSTGATIGQNGYLNITNTAGNMIMVGSTQPGVSLDAHIVKLVASQPYNISVLEISNLIVPPGIGSPAPAPAPVPTGAPPAPAPLPMVVAGAPVVDSAPGAEGAAQGAAAGTATASAATRCMVALEGATTAMGVAIMGALL